MSPRLTTVEVVLTMRWPKVRGAKGGKEGGGDGGGDGGGGDGGGDGGGGDGGGDGGGGGRSGGLPAIDLEDPDGLDFKSWRSML